LHTGTRRVKSKVKRVGNRVGDFCRRIRTVRGEGPGAVEFRSRWKPSLADLLGGEVVLAALGQ